MSIHKCPVTWKSRLRLGKKAIIARGQEKARGEAKTEG
jgi:hypothetical protein